MLRPPPFYLPRNKMLLHTTHYLLQRTNVDTGTTIRVIITIFSAWFYKLLFIRRNYASAEARVYLRVCIFTCFERGAEYK